MTDALVTTLAERKNTHGSFQANAEVAQAIKDVMRASPNWASLPDTVKEALDVIALKQSRILTGDWRHLDHYHDGAGYFRLAEQHVFDLTSKA